MTRSLERRWRQRCSAVLDSLVLAHYDQIPVAFVAFAASTAAPAAVTAVYTAAAVLRAASDTTVIVVNIANYYYAAITPSTATAITG